MARTIRNAVFLRTQEIVHRQRTCRKEDCVSVLDQSATYPLKPVAAAKPCNVQRTTLRSRGSPDDFEPAILPVGQLAVIRLKQARTSIVVAMLQRSKLRPRPRRRYSEPPPDKAALPSPENRDGCGRYPLRVRTLYFLNCSPTSLTVIARHPALGLGFG